MICAWAQNHPELRDKEVTLQRGVTQVLGNLKMAKIILEIYDYQQKQMFGFPL